MVPGDCRRVGVEDGSPPDPVRRQHLTPLTSAGGRLADGAQILLRGLPGTDRHAAHAVHSADWYHPVAGEPTATDARQHAPAGVTS